MDNQLLTIEQVAERLQVSEETVRSYINAKKNPLPAVKLSRRYRIRPDELEAWLERRRTNKEEQQ